jgi:outer membrane protein assembly factor BamB
MLRTVTVIAASTLVLIAAATFAADSAPLSKEPTGYTGAPGDWYGGGVKMDAGDWPQWRGPTRSGVSTETGLLDKWPENGPPLAWKLTGTGRSLSAPVVLKGRMYLLGDFDGICYLQCFDFTNQKLIWKTKIGKAWASYSDGPSPTLDGEAAFGQTGEGDNYCIALADGKLRWVKNCYKDYNGGVMNPQYGFVQSPLVDGKKVIFNPGGQKDCVVAVDRDTGATIWSIPASATGGPKGSDKAAYASPVISMGGGVKQYVLMVGHGLIGVRPEDGKVFWTYNLAGGEANIPTPIVRGDYVYDCNSYGSGTVLLKLSADGNGEVKAEKIYHLSANVCQNLEGQSVLVGDYTFTGMGGYSGEPICVEFITGKVMWKGKQAGAGVAGLTAADGKLIYRAESGEVSLLKASGDGHNLISVFHPEDGCKKSEPHWANPVVSHGLLLIRQYDMLLAFDLKKK